MPDDDPTHGLMRSRPPQTFCGLNTNGRRVTDDPFQVSCNECIRLMHLTDNMPNLGGEIQKRGRGRPRKRGSAW